MNREPQTLQVGGEIPDARLYEVLGGSEGCRRLAAAFYARVPADPILSAVYSHSFHCALPNLTDFLAHVFAAPGAHPVHRYDLSLRESHRRFRIGQAERDAWLRAMQAALEEVEVPEPARSALCRFFAESSAFLINRPDARAGGKEGEAEVGTVPQEGESTCVIHREAARIWNRQAAFEAIVQAARTGDSDRVLALLESEDVQDWLEKDRFTKLSLLAVLGGSDALLAYVTAELTAHPELVRTPYTYDGTLLHAAARSESPEFVRLLLRLGADPNASDRFGHVPLGSVHHPEIVRALVEGGADVNARDGLKGVTALHNAARHGNVAVGAALLECGAGMESRDDLGDTPLRRAVNCGKTEMAAFLLERGADRHSVGSRGLTPAQAARGQAMKQLLCS